MSWIKCTEATVNIVTYVNMDLVAKVQRYSTEQVTRLFTTSPHEKNEVIFVKETPEQVIQLLINSRRQPRA